MSLLVAGAVTSSSVAESPIDSSMPTVEFEKFELENGLRVVLSVDSTAPVVATAVHYHVGSKNERPDRTGFAHFFEHLMFEGTENIPRHSIDKFVQGAGGRLNAYTTFDETVYQIQVPRNELELALWIESERMMHAKVNEVGVETQRDVVKEERKNRYENQPYGSVLEYIAENVGKGTPYEWTPIGSAQYIDQATIDEFRAFYKRYYVPNNAVLAIVGDFNPDEVKKMVREYFGEIARGTEIDRPDFNYGLLDKESVVTVEEDHTPLPALIYAYRIPAQDHPDSYPLQILTTVLAQGESSILYRTLVDEEQIALQASSFPFALEDGGMFGMLAIGRDPGASLEKLGSRIDEIVSDIQENGITERQFEKAINQIETDLASSFDNVLRKAISLSQAETYYNDPNHINTEWERFQEVTVDDVKRVANTYLKPDNRAVVKYVVPGS